MARYDGKWWVLRYWLAKRPLGYHVKDARESERHNNRRYGGDSGHYTTNEYVGMWFPEALYPTDEHLPAKREELPIWL